MQIPLFKTSLPSEKSLNKIEEVFEENSTIFAKTNQVRPAKIIEIKPTSDGNFSLFKKTQLKPDSIL
jgi:hypothetical protein